MGYFVALYLCIVGSIFHYSYCNEDSGHVLRLCDGDGDEALSWNEINRCIISTGSYLDQTGFQALDKDGDGLLRASEIEHVVFNIPDGTPCDVAAMRKSRARLLMFIGTHSARMNTLCSAIKDELMPVVVVAQETCSTVMLDSFSTYIREAVENMEAAGHCADIDVTGLSNTEHVTPGHAEPCSKRVYSECTRSYLADLQDATEDPCEDLRVMTACMAEATEECGDEASAGQTDALAHFSQMYIEYGACNNLLIFE